MRRRFTTRSCQRLHARRGRRAGVALLMAVLVVAISFILIVAFMDAASIEFSLAGGYERYTKALCVADAGLADAVAILADGGTTADATKSNVEFPAGSGYQYSVSVTGSEPDYTIAAQGRSNDIARAIEADVYIEGGKAIILQYTEVEAP